MGILCAYIYNYNTRPSYIGHVRGYYGWEYSYIWHLIQANYIQVICLFTFYWYTVTIKGFAAMFVITDSNICTNSPGVNTSAHTGLMSHSQGIYEDWAFECEHLQDC